MLPDTAQSIGNGIVAPLQECQALLALERQLRLLLLGAKQRIGAGPQFSDELLLRWRGRRGGGGGGAAALPRVSAAADGICRWRGAGVLALR